MCRGWFAALGIVDYQVMQSSRHSGLDVSSGAVVAGFGCLHGLYIASDEYRILLFSGFVSPKECKCWDDQYSPSDSYQIVYECHSQKNSNVLITLVIEAIIKFFRQQF